MYKIAAQQRIIWPHNINSAEVESPWCKTRQAQRKSSINLVVTIILKLLSKPASAPPFFPSKKMYHYLSRVQGQICTVSLTPLFSSSPNPVPYQRFLVDNSLNIPNPYTSPFSLVHPHHSKPSSVLPGCRQVPPGSSPTFCFCTGPTSVNSTQLPTWSSKNATRSRHSAA